MASREACAELPPRARRIPTVPWRHSNHQGTTSACAENTQQLSITDRIKRNYLRVRGEYAYPRRVNKAKAELPPRARRIPHHVCDKLLRQGTTSACAENTLSVAPGLRVGGNYLRVRGEYNQGKRPNHGSEELPPRARRIPARTIVPAVGGGTTSACAENTGCV